MSLDESFIRLRSGVGTFLALYVEDKAGLKTGNYSTTKDYFCFNLPGWLEFCHVNRCFDAVFNNLISAIKSKPTDYFQEL